MNDKKNAEIAVYAGSFDPITFGHIDIINRASNLFPKLIIAVIGNPGKSTFFSFEERVKMIKSVIGQNDNIIVDVFDGLLMDYMKKVNSKVVVRGLRAISDFEYEFQMALSNNKLDPEVETIFMMANERYSYISSRLIKEIALFGGDVSAFVPETIGQKLALKRNEISKKEMRS